MGNLYNTHEQQYTRVSSIKNHQRWYYEDNNGVYQPYDVATSQWLNKASVGASTTIQYSNRTYSIRKVSHNECNSSRGRSTKSKTHTATIVSNSAKIPLRMRMGHLAGISKLSIINCFILNRMRWNRC
eukprot:278681_1